MLDPIRHAESVTGRRQSVLVDCWADLGLAATHSEVTGPHIYDYGALPVSTVAITLYDVRRHILVEDGKLKRDAGVRAGRFRIGQPGRAVFVDAVPAVESGSLMLLYLGQKLTRDLGGDFGSEQFELADPAWEVDDPLVSSATRRIVDASREQPGRSLLIEQLTLGLALHIADRYMLRPRTLPGDDDGLSTIAIGKVWDLIRQSPTVSLVDLAVAAGVSTSSLLRRFKKSTGLTPHQFVLKQRVLLAQDLLRSTRKPIAQIALDIGFSSQSHFGAAFKSITGGTPAQYRRSVRSNMTIFRQKMS